jgi:hypothetical protein
MLFFRIFPILSIYEMEEIAEHEEPETDPGTAGVAAW